jgi:hypothetical protein
MASNDIEAIQARAEKDAHLEFFERKATLIRSTIASLEQLPSESRKTLGLECYKFFNWITSAMNHTISEFQALQEANTKSLKDDLTKLSDFQQQLQKATTNEAIKDLMADVEAIDVDKKV